MSQIATQFFIDHAPLFSALAVSVIDLAMAANPKLASNGLLHFFYLKMKGGE